MPGAGRPLSGTFNLEAINNARTEAPGFGGAPSSSYFVQAYPNTVGGYWCSCGAFVADGDSHQCFQFAPPQPYSFQIQAKQSPHKCPVCEGKGKVAFDPDKPLRRTRGEFDCRPCSGTGIIWG